MSEEEKKAIEWLKKADWFSARKYAPSILQLIDKQQKEIEELKKENFDTVYIQAIENYKAKIREIISKYVDIEEQFNYGSIELFGEELTNMIKELLDK